jgi:adenine-specific DNA-methyltransferase
MVNYSCKKCGKTFNQKGHYTKHLKRKTPCDNNKDNIEKIVENKFNEMAKKLLKDIDIENKTKELMSNQNNIEMGEKSIHNSYEELKTYYDDTLNKDKKTFKTKNDEPTPIDCIEYMISKIPNDFWNKEDIKILDPCSGNGNFYIPILYKLREKYTDEDIFNKLYFNDINEERLNNIKKIFDAKNNKLNITQLDFLNFKDDILYDLIVANPPYAKLLDNGKRASKNHNMIKDFIIKSLKLLKDDGYILYITPDNWMSKADRNTLIMELTKYQIIHLNIHKSKDYFPKIGSSFTWYIVQKKPFYKDIEVEGRWQGKEYTSMVPSRVRSFIPQFYNSLIDSITQKTIENTNIPKFKIETTSDLHKYTKKHLISTDKDETHKYKLIHTPKQTVYASRPHKWQDGWKVFISTTDKYGSFIDNCGMTQSIAFIRCESKEQAEQYKKLLDHELYKFINNICRWGNFNNVRILQSFPIPVDTENVWNNFLLNDEEIQFIKSN